jgi:LTXXQ motif family protein
MSTTTRTALSAFVLAAAIAVAPIVGFAQASPPAATSDQETPAPPYYGPMMGGWGFGSQGMMGYGGMGPSMMGGRGYGQFTCTAMAGHVDGQLAYLKAELKITAAQETLWKSYEAAARDNANAMLAHCTAMMDRSNSAGLSLPDRLTRHEQFMADQLEALRATTKAFKPLYAAFSASQKKDADQMFWGFMGMM